MSIEDYLISLNFDIFQNRAFQYWKEAIRYCQNKEIFKMEDVYNHIAKKYKSKRNAVEIAMRRCMSNADFKTISGNKPIKTNKKILILIL